MKNYTIIKIYYKLSFFNYIFDILRKVVLLYLLLYYFLKYLILVNIFSNYSFGMQFNFDIFEYFIKIFSQFFHLIF
jgi:hypothetical protein